MALDPRLLHEDIQAGQVRAARAVSTRQQALSVPPADVLLAEGAAEQKTKILARQIRVLLRDLKFPTASAPRGRYAENKKRDHGQTVRPQN